MLKAEASLEYKLSESKDPVELFFILFAKDN